MDPIILRPFRRDDADWLVERHSTLYARDEGFDDTFGPLVADIIKAFLASHDATRERGWVAEDDEKRLGSIFCVAQSEQTAKLRLFLVDPVARGRGVGRHLLDTCMQFARHAGYADMTLWTHESHRAACLLYKRAGWTIASSAPVHNYGVDLVEQTWKITL